MANYIRVQLKASGIGREQSQKDTLRALGLRRFGQERIHPDTPSLRGMLNKLKHLVSFEKSETAEIKKTKKAASYRLL
ncbi:MAG: 50S ribosomal protein L30 [Deltaproteobacteria bacterium]|nr:50S ribosomal protein L30 [Deltaproteobacteria bacterium]